MQEAIKFCILYSLPVFVSRDTADRVVTGQGKFEELMACAHEIAASTTQLVVASKVSRIVFPAVVFVCLFQWRAITPNRFTSSVAECFLYAKSRKILVGELNSNQSSEENPLHASVSLSSEAGQRARTPNRFISSVTEFFSLSDKVKQSYYTGKSLYI